MFTDPAFEREFRAALAASPDSEAARATAARIRDGDIESWLLEWTASGGEAWTWARRHDCAALYLQAAACYGAALALIADADGSVDEAQLWERQRACWEQAVRLVGGESLAIAYEDTTLPGFFFAAAAAPRPLVVIDHGGRMPTSQASVIGSVARDAGFHWMTFDGPGRQAALVRQGLLLRPDWEAVLGPVADAMAARADVGSMAVIGLEHAGYGVTRALAFEHRFAAGIVDPGIVDVSLPWLDALPAPAREALLSGERDAFERELHLVGLFEPGSNELRRRRGRWYDAGRSSPYDLYRRIMQFRLGDEIGQIATPMLVAEGGGASFWPAQGETLFARLRAPKARASEIAIADWLRQQLAPRPPGTRS